MGLFDSVYAPCPHCGQPVEFQTKVGDPYCRSFTLESASPEQLIDIMNFPEHCEKCDGWLALIDPRYPPGEKPRPELRVAKVKTPENPGTHWQGMKWWPTETFSYDDLQEPVQSKGE